MQRVPQRTAAHEWKRGTGRRYQPVPAACTASGLACPAAAPRGQQTPRHPPVGPCCKATAPTPRVAGPGKPCSEAGTEVTQLPTVYIRIHGLGDGGISRHFTSFTVCRIGASSRQHRLAWPGLPLGLKKYKKSWRLGGSAFRPGKLPVPCGSQAKLQPKEGKQRQSPGCCAVHQAGPGTLQYLRRTSSTLSMRWNWSMTPGGGSGAGTVPRISSSSAGICGRTLNTITGCNIAFKPTGQPEEVWLCTGQTCHPLGQPEAL